jgi:hypothetical protein
LAHETSGCQNASPIPLDLAQETWGDIGTSKCTNIVDNVGQTLNLVCEAVTARPSRHSGGKRSGRSGPRQAPGQVTASGCDTACEGQSFPTTGVAETWQCRRHLGQCQSHAAMCTSRGLQSVPRCRDTTRGPPTCGNPGALRAIEASVASFGMHRAIERVRNSGNQTGDPVGI